MSNPSKPVDISSPRLAFNDDALTTQAPGSFVPSIGTPDLRALRAQYASTPPILPNIPPRGAATPIVRAASPIAVCGADSSPRPGRLLSQPDTPGELGSGSNANAPATPADLDELPEEEKIKVLRRHLVSKDERRAASPSGDRASASSDAEGAAAAGTSTPSSNTRPNRVRREDTEPFPVPYHAPGADITHDIYKWQSQRQQVVARSRAASFSGGRSAPVDPAFEHIHEPGGFRRNYVLLRANEQGAEGPVVLNNFIDFLFIFGHFAGEDLEEDEEEDDRRDDEESARLVSGLSPADAERQPLLQRSKTTRSRRRRNSVAENGEVTVAQAVLMLLKAFIGTGVLFLGKAFYNGGLLFSVLCISFIALISLYSFLLLVRTKFVVPGSFGDIGGKLYGRWMRLAILSSITISQIGFVAAYTIFVAENLQSFVMAVTNCLTEFPVRSFILLQLVIFLPLALIRSLAKLSTTALVADGFILLGLLYIFGSEVGMIAKRGVADVKMFNSRDFPLFIGTAVFSFEGIGLILPITDSMREPRKFPAVLTGVMIFLMFLFGGAGALSYLTFGQDVQAVVLVNFDSENKMVQAVQFIYSLAILLSVPLQLFPAVRIMENGLFTRSGKANMRVKWLKNFFRFAVVMLCTLISALGAKDLDKFVAFVGSFACVPLCYIYPAMLHYKACAHTRKQKIADIALLVFGVVASIYTTVQTVRLMFSPESGSPQYGRCGAPPLR